MRGEGKGEGRKPRSNPGTGRTLGYYALAFLAALVILTSPAHAEQKTLTGTVAYDGRIPLPSDALLEVRLVDKSVPGAPPRVVTRSVQAADGYPIAFKLSFDDTVILSGHRYALDARIGSATAIWFASGDESTIDPLSTRYPVRLSVGMIARPPVGGQKPDVTGGDPDSDDGFDN
jgi:putative lipoprotein